jgi:hypothetical protein
VAVQETSSPFRRVRSMCAALALLALNTASYAQSCALCYTQAAAAGNRIIQGLRSGILVLVIPPLFMSVGITVLAYRKRNRCGVQDSERSHDEW